MLDRIKVTSATTGTGTYTLDSGSATGYRSFFDASPSTAIMVPYIAVSGSSWECGYGVYDGNNPGTLTRAEIMASSNSGSAVSWPAGAKEIVAGALASTFIGPGLRHAWREAGAPTVNDDETKGFSAGSLWETGSDLYKCYSAGAGAANWFRMSSPLRKVGAGNVADISFDPGAADDPSPRTEFNIAMYRDDGVTAFKQRTAQILAGADTNGTTPSTVSIDAPSGGGVLKGVIVATINAGANVRHSKAWNAEIVYRSTGATATIIGSASVTSIAGDTALSGATAAAAASGGDIQFTLTGVTGETVTWSVSLRCDEVLGS